FNDGYAGDPNLNADAASSRLDAYANGVLQTPALTRLSGVNIDKDPTGSINTSQITDLTSSTVDFNGAATFDLSNVVNLTYSTINLSGAGRTLTLSRATGINGASFYVAGGAHLSLPAATSYSHASTNSFQDRHFQASGPGSELDLTGLASITNGT